MPEGQRGQLQVLLGMVRLLAARQRGNPLAAAEEAQRLQALAETPDTAQYDLASAARAGLGEELRALTLISLGHHRVLGYPAGGQRHLKQGVALARRIGRPYLEFSGLAYQTIGEIPRSLAQVAEHSRQAGDRAGLAARLD